MILSKKKKYLDPKIKFSDLKYPKSEKALKFYNIRAWSEFGIEKLVKDLLDPPSINDPISDSDYIKMPWRRSHEYLNLNVPFDFLAEPSSNIEWDLFRLRYYFEDKIIYNYDKSSICSIFINYSKLDSENYPYVINRICKEIGINELY